MEIRRSTTLRSLTLEELDHVSGSGDDPIVVTAKTKSSDWGGGGLGGPFNFRYLSGAGAGTTGPEAWVGGSGEPVKTAQWQAPAAVGIVGDAIKDILVDKAIKSSEKEQKIADQFDPNEVVRNLQGMDRNGQIDPGWQMRDGSRFYDTDGNGKPDMRMWTDKPGNVWIDTGDGRTLVRGTG